MQVGEIARAVEKDGAGEVLQEAEVSCAAEVDCSGKVEREVRLVRFVEVEGVASELGG